jgi:serine/threonine protein kinase
MRAFDIFQDESCLYCVSELLRGGHLGLLRQNALSDGIELSEVYFQFVFAQCLEGLRHMHEKALMHCDIKEPNILVRHADYLRPQIAIIDMGMARNAAGHGRAGGTPGYMPPETMKNNVWYPKGDIFSMGVTFFQILADKIPDEAADKRGIFQEGAHSIQDVERFVCSREVPMELIQDQYPGTVKWLPRILEKDRRKRPMSPQVLEEPWFQTEYRKARASVTSWSYADGSSPSHGVISP